MSSGNLLEGRLRAAAEGGEAFNHTISPNTTDRDTELGFLIAWLGRWYPKTARAEIHASPMATGHIAIA